MPAGAKHILGETNPAQVPRDSVYGVLSTQLTVDPEYHCAAEAALRFCLNAILVRDTSTAMRMLRHLSTQSPGPARIFAVDSLPNTVPADVSIPGSVRLLDHVRASDNIIGFIRKLLANVIVVPNLDSIPEPLPSELVLVTRNGAMIRGDGYAEFWFPSSIPDSTASSEKTLKDIEHQLESARTEISAAESSLQKLTAEEKMLLDSLRTVQNALDQQRHTFAVREGEYQIVSTESNQARDRLDTVTWEINNLTTSEKSIPSQRASITAEIDTARSQREKVFTSIESATKSLAVLENRQAELQADVTKQSMKFAQINQVVEHLQSNQASALKRLAELENLIQSRSDGIVSYENQVKHLKESISEAENRIVSLKNAVETNTAKADGMKKNMEKQVKELEKLESVLDQKSSALETLRATGSNLTVKLTETTMRRQNHIDRITSDYSMTEAQLMEQPEPQWQAEKPSIDALETMIAELRTKLEAMGPVNLVAIEEYQELEERYTFLTQQEQDLVNSKQQLVELIKKINRTTSEMFSSTFAAVNENFQAMFKRLFNGGSAKLVLVNEEDVLECGIEIIARPPGKRLQNISLLSGGEKTLTAVALLFAIYMIRPSPFCLLDELDAPLDESNIGRFVNVLQEFLRQSQFVVITHNRQTIAAAGVLYGITMPEKGVSKIVSMKFTDQKTRTFGAPTPVEPVTTS
jgi:chromosome segregation protein